jgi:aminomethyltransferase
MSEAMSSAIVQSRSGNDSVGAQAMDERRDGSLREEYRLLREGIGLSDYRAMGKFKVLGPASLELVNRVVLADVSRVPIKKMLATFILREDGGVVCETYVANLGDGYLLLTEGASPAEIAGLLANEARDVPGTEVVDTTRETALFSVDGPYAWELMKDLVGMAILGARYLEVVTDQSIAGTPATIYRAGKTGEFGYWIEVGKESAERTWAALLEAGRPFDLAPCGSEATDLCKLENRFINVVREGARAGNVLELNCRTMVSRDKGEYRGRAAVESVIERGLRRRLIGLALERGSPSDELPELGAAVSYRGVAIGKVANVAYSYTLGRPIAVAFLDVDYAYVGLDYDVGPSCARSNARTVSAPFVFNKSLAIRFQESSYLARDSR